MKSAQVLKSIVAASVCAFALVVAVGCSAGGSSSAASSSSDASSSSASSSVSSASSSSSSAASSSAASSSAASASSAAGLTEESAVAQGYQVFKGTVRVCNAKELIDLQGVNIDPAAASGGGTYAVLVFDAPTNVTGMYADGSGENTRSANMLGIAEHTDYSSFVVEYGDLDYCKKLDGEKVTLAAKSKNIMFPSDVRLPINEPSAQDVVFLS